MSAPCLCSLCGQVFEDNGYGCDHPVFVLHGQINDVGGSPTSHTCYSLAEAEATIINPPWDGWVYEVERNGEVLPFYIQNGFDLEYKVIWG